METKIMEHQNRLENGTLEKGLTFGKLSAATDTAASAVAPQGGAVQPKATPASAPPPSQASAKKG